MSIRLTIDLVEALAATPTGSSVEIPIDGADELALAERWAAATGNTLLAVHPHSVEMVRGRVDDPVEALSLERRPGYRLWVYTNFHCNLACDYCCVRSSPRAEPRVITVDDFTDLVDQARSAGVGELFITGGEPFMLLDLDERIRLAVDAGLPVTVLTNASVWNGERRRRLEALPRHCLTLQVSLDSATAPVHDRHRGAGSFDAAVDGIRLALDLGFRVRVASTVAVGESDEDLDGFFDELGLDPDQRIVRKIARQGAANDGLVVSRRSLIPEVCVTAEGVWWHPVAAIDPAMKVRDHWSPLAESIDEIRDEFRLHRIKGDVLASTFPCA